MVTTPDPEVVKNWYWCGRSLQEGSGECKHKAEEKHINGCDDKAFEDPCSECISMVTKEGPGSRNGYIESRTDDI